MTRTFRYIPISKLHAALAMGWYTTPALIDTHHGEYSVLCEWLCDCEIPALSAPRPLSHAEESGS